MKKITYNLLPHIAKFIAAEYGIGNPWKMNAKTPMGQFIESIMRCRLEHKRHSQQVLDKYSVAFDVEVHDFQAWTAIRRSTPSKVILLNNGLKVFFYDRFKLYMLYARAHGAEIEEAIQGFMESYGLTEEDIKIETLKKHYTRHVK